MRDLNGRVERLERRMASDEDGMIVLEVPYRPDISDEVLHQKALEQKGMTESDIGSRTLVFITNYAA